MLHSHGRAGGETGNHCFFQRELNQKLTVFEAGVERDNLYFEVQEVSRMEKDERLHKLLCERLTDDNDGSAIVYCATQGNTEYVAEVLARHDWPVAPFHAGLSVSRKQHIQESFIDGSLRIICATNAFGMGIDKDDVRLVVHYNIPGSLENYLQEAGRAGRDRAMAE